MPAYTLLRAMGVGVNNLPSPDSDDCNHPKPTASGAQSAIVVGADGLDQPAGVDELHWTRWAASPAHWSAMAQDAELALHG